MKITLRKFTSPLYCFCIVLLLTICSSSLQAQVSANFVASSVHICQGDSVNFTNLSTGAISYVWAENAIPFSNQTSPSRTFNTPGTYLISMLATDGLNNDTTSTLILVNPALGSMVTGADASCNGFTDGSADLTPLGGTPNLSLCFDGINDYVDADSVTNTNFNGGITIEGWIKPSLVWNTNDGMVVAFNTTLGANHFLLSYNRNLQRFIYFDDVVGNQQQTGNSPLGQWTHLALTITGSNQGTMYINGVSVRQFTTGTSWIPNGGRCSIGQEYDGQGTSQHFNGCMDEVRIWNTALTATTILDNYNNSCGNISPAHPNINNLTAYWSFNEGSGNLVYDRSGNDNHGTFNGISWGLPIDNNYGCFGEGTGFAYSWSNSANTEDLAAVGAGTYNVTITDGAGCVATDSVVIGEPTAIAYTVSLTPDDTLCEGDTVGVSVAGGYTYSYSPAGGLSATSGSSIDAFPTATTTYEIVAEDTNNCRDTSNFTLVVNPLPTASVTGNSPICFGESTTLTASGGIAYDWSTTDTTASITVAPTTSGSFIVNVTDANGCSDDTSFNVVVNPLPVVTFSGDSTICVGDTANIVASGGTDYNWNTGANSAGISVSPPADSLYTVITLDANFCQSIDSFLLVVNPLPTVGITGDTVICEGDTANLTASGGTAYVWSTTDVTAGIQVNPVVTTTYSVVVTDGNTCSNSDSIEVAVNGLPTVSIALIGSDTLCAGDSVVLDASGAASYVWNTTEVTQSINVNPPSTTTYSVTGTDANGCEGTASQAVVVNALPVITIAGMDTICVGDTTMLIASGATSYSWDIGDSTAAIDVSPATTTTYSVDGTDANGCMGSASVTVEVSAIPTPTVIDNGNGNLSTQTGFASYQWYLNGSPIAGATSDTYIATANGNYSVEVTNAAGCIGLSPGEDIIVISIDGTLFSNLEIYPNPNQGQFTIRLSMERSSELELNVLNMMGQQIYRHDAGMINNVWSHNLDLGQIASGVYLVELKADGQRSLRRVVVE